MFTSLSANVGFNPLLAGALTCGALPEQCPPQQEEAEAGDWGPIHRGRGNHLPPNLRWHGQKQTGMAFLEVNFRPSFLQSRWSCYSPKCLANAFRYSGATCSPRKRKGDCVLEGRVGMTIRTCMMIPAALRGALTCTRHKIRPSLTLDNFIR